MKNMIFFSIFFLMMLYLSGCAVNETTGLITITNLTDKDFNNIKIGGTVLSAYLSKGVKVDYWYYKNLFGNLTGSGITKVIYVNNTNSTTTSYDEPLNFLPGYEYHIEVILQENKHCYFYIYSGRKGEYSYADIDPDDGIHDPRE